jgi:protein-tyrosine phosphatase
LLLLLPLSRVIIGGSTCSKHDAQMQAKHSAFILQEVAERVAKAQLQCENADHAETEMKDCAQAAEWIRRNAELTRRPSSTKQAMF